MPIYKQLPRLGKKKRLPPFYRPIDRALFYLWEKRRTLAPFGIAGLILILFWGGLRIYSHRYEQKADFLMETGELSEVVRKFSRSKVALIARVKLGAEALREGRADEAIEWYRPVTERASGREMAIFRIGAFHGLGLAYLKKGELDQAVTWIDRAADDPENATSDYSRLLLANLYERKGEKEKASDIYKLLSEEATLTEIKNEAKEKLTWPEKGKSK